MSRAPTVWVLLGKGTGGNGQMISLAEALGWPFESKQLIYSRASHIPNLLLGPSLAGIDRRQSAPLAPPWPDLVIAGSRRSAPVARWIKRQSGGTAKLVHLMHAQAPLEHFDLIITTPQYRLPARANVLQLAAPLHHVDPVHVEAAAERWRPRIASLPRPYTALLVGGDSSSYLLDAATAARLGRQASAQVRAAGGALLISTSPRTPAAAAQALLVAVDCPAYTYQWRRGDADNPYLSFLGLADDFIVTADSASQLAEACATGKAVHIFEWPLRPESHRGIRGVLRGWGEMRDRQARAAAAQLPPLARLYDRLVYLGLFKPARDFAAYHRALRQRGLVADLGAPAAAPRAPLDDMQRAVERIRLVLGVGVVEARSEAPIGAPPANVAERAPRGAGHRAAWDA